jgi:hypothetical protein
MTSKPPSSNRIQAAGWHLSGAARATAYFQHQQQHETDAWI